MAENQTTKIQDDIPIWGASRIAAEIGLDRGAVYHLLGRNLLRLYGEAWGG